MKTITLFAFVTMIIAVVVVADEKYTTKYDGVDLQQILRNKRLLRNYVFCVLDKGPCSPAGAVLKKLLPDALETNCSKCSERQKKGSRVVLRHLFQNEPEYFRELERKFDSSGNLRLKYEKEAMKEGIVL